MVDDRVSVVERELQGQPPLDPDPLGQPVRQPTELSAAGQDHRLALGVIQRLDDAPAMAAIARSSLNR